jgi:hypothetical protein
MLNKLNAVTILSSLTRSMCPVYNIKPKINTEPKEPIKSEVELRVIGKSAERWTDGGGTEHQANASLQLHLLQILSVVL